MSKKSSNFDLLPQRGPFESTVALLCKRQSFNRSNFHVQAQMNYFV